MEEFNKRDPTPLEKKIVGMINQFGVLMTIAKIDQEINDSELTEGKHPDDLDLSRLELLGVIPPEKPLLKKLSVILMILASNLDTLDDLTKQVPSLLLSGILIELNISYVGYIIVTPDWKIYAPANKLIEQKSAIVH